MKKIAVTGNAGYIGSHIFKQFENAYYGVFGYDDFSAGHTFLLRHRIGPTYNVSITQDFGIENINAVIHCAAIATVQESIKYPVSCFDINVGGTLNLIKKMQEHGVKNIIFSSTCAIDGNHPYAKSKKMAEEIIKDSGLNYAILRYYNVAGADPDGELGEMHNPETHLIPLAIEAAVTGKTLPIYNHGEDVRDYIHVSDVARYNLQALERLERGEASFIETVGTGVGYSTLQVINRVEHIVGRPISLVYENGRKNEPSSLIAPKPCANDLRDLDNIIETAYNWYKKLND